MSSASARWPCRARPFCLPCEAIPFLLHLRMAKSLALPSSRRGAPSDGRRKLSSMLRDQHVAALRVGSWRSIQRDRLAASHRRSLVCSKACIIGLGHHIGCPEALLCTCQCEHHVCMAPRRVSFVRNQHTCGMQSCQLRKKIHEPCIILLYPPLERSPQKSRAEDKTQLKLLSWPR